MNKSQGKHKLNYKIINNQKNITHTVSLLFTFITQDLTQEQNSDVGE